MAGRWAREGLTTQIQPRGPRGQQGNRSASRALCWLRDAHLSKPEEPYAEKSEFHRA